MLSATVRALRLGRAPGTRWASTDVARALTLQEFGVPEKVLKMSDGPIPSSASLGDNEVLINILAVSLEGSR